MVSMCDLYLDTIHGSVRLQIFGPKTIRWCASLAVDVRRHKALGRRSERFIMVVCIAGHCILCTAELDPRIEVCVPCAIGVS
jgi:hypothetical protein